MIGHKSGSASCSERTSAGEFPTAQLQAPGSIFSSTCMAALTSSTGPADRDDFIG